MDEDVAGKEARRRVWKKREGESGTAPPATILNPLLPPPIRGWPPHRAAALCEGRGGRRDWQVILTDKEGEARCAKTDAGAGTGR